MAERGNSNSRAWARLQAGFKDLTLYESPVHRFYLKREFKQKPGERKRAVRWFLHIDDRERIDNLIGARSSFMKLATNAAEVLLGGDAVVSSEHWFLELIARGYCTRWGWSTFLDDGTEVVEQRMADVVVGSINLCALLAREADGRGTTPPYPMRADWFKRELKVRGWTESSMATKHGSPDYKTLRKISEGQAVQDRVLDRLAKALGVPRHQIPNS